jgi:hypothetical protein
MLQTFGKNLQRYVLHTFLMTMEVTYSFHITKPHVPLRKKMVLTNGNIQNKGEQIKFKVWRGILYIGC